MPHRSVNHLPNTEMWSTEANMKSQSVASLTFGFFLAECGIVFWAVFVCAWADFQDHPVSDRRFELVVAELLACDGVDVDFAGVGVHAVLLQ